MRKGVVVLATLVMLSGTGLTAQDAPGRTDAEARARAVETLGRKFVALAEEVPLELQDWRPMEGVRSFREVVALVAAELAWFPEKWDGDGTFSDPGFQETLASVGAMSWEEMVGSLDQAVPTYAAALLRGAGDHPHSVSFGGGSVARSTALGLLQLDMHEHLGQLIAYARMNRIVPPWSRAR